MALKQDITVEYDSGLVAPIQNAYIKVENYSGDKETTTIYVNTYLSQSSVPTGKDPVRPTEMHIFQHSTEVDAPNVIKQGYEYLKTLPQYSTAIDVLEE